VQEEEKEEQEKVRHWRSVEESHMPHGGRVLLGIQQDPVPANQSDGLVIAVTYGAARIDLGVSNHPLSTTALAGCQASVLFFHALEGPVDLDRITHRSNLSSLK
jgi:hypothetical protein